jgi:hypothetical protein
MMTTVLEGFDLATIERMIGELSLTRNNLRNATSKRAADKAAEKAAAAA